MIQQVLHRQFLEDITRQLQQEAAAPPDDRRSSSKIPMDSFTAAERDDLQEALAGASDELSKAGGTAQPARRGPAATAPSTAEPFVAGSPEVSNLQSAIEYYYTKQQASALESAGQGEGRRRGAVSMAGDQRLKQFPEYLQGRRAFGKFQQTDIRWIGSWFSEGWRKFKGRHPFVDRPVRGKPIELPDEQLRIVVVGDWGSGIERARKVARCMRRELDDPAVAGWQRHVVHLGDVYYSGWEYEYRDRFLKYWPVLPEEKHKIGSFNLNGNHDMYSGGWDFFDVSLKDERFCAWQGASSLFTMANKRWQIFGLDTSYADADLAGDQPAWIRSAALPDRKLVFLSHHQYCTSYEKPATKIVRAIDPVLKQGKVAAWLWGHEHRCMVYNAVGGIRYPACLGHGGVPVYQTHDANGPIPSPGRWEYRDFVDGGVELWAKFGFVTLDFYSDKIKVRYINEDGDVHRTGDIIE